MIPCGVSLSLCVYLCLRVVAPANAKFWHILSAYMCISSHDWSLQEKTAKRQHTNSQKHAVDTAHSTPRRVSTPLSAAFYVDTKNFSFPGQPACCTERATHSLPLSFSFSLSFSAKKRRKVGKIQQTFSRISKNNFYATLSQKKATKIE